jgi:Ran GTPase-activating protein (RanGAP) involved in mRNA processing and transport
MGALTSLHVKQNGIPQREMREIIAIAMRMDSMKILCEVPFKDKTLIELDVSGKNLGTEGALVIAEYLDGNRTLSSLNLASNCIGGYQDISSPFTFHATPEGRTFVLPLYHYCSYSVLISIGPAAIADAIKDMGAISSVNLLGNFIGVEQAQELIKILHTKEKLTTLCGFIGDETELNLSKKNLSAGCGALVANEISDMRALTKLSLAKNRLCNKEAGKILGEMLAANTEHCFERTRCF